MEVREKEGKSNIILSYISFKNCFIEIQITCHKIDPFLSVPHKV